MTARLQSYSKKHVLFVCTHNEVRSLTAEQLYRGRRDLEVRSAGIASHAKNQLTGDLVAWADVIVVFEPRHLALVKRLFPNVEKHSQVLCLKMDDIYEYKSPKLIIKLASKLKPYLGKPLETSAMSDTQWPLVTRLLQNRLFEKA